MTNGPLITTQDLYCSYGAVDVIINANFSIEPGSIVVLMGENGSGKSTLLRCLAGWSCPKSGTVLLYNKPYNTLTRQEKSEIVFVADTPAFYDDLTADEHIKFVLGVNNKSQNYPEAESLLKTFGLYKHREQYPSSYSRGMREKLALVIAFILQPKIYLLDEPYAPLDSLASTELSKKLNSIAKSGSSVLVSCHQQVLDLEPDYFLTINDGSVVINEALEGVSWSDYRSFSAEASEEEG